MHARKLPKLAFVFIIWKRNNICSTFCGVCSLKAPLIDMLFMKIAYIQLKIPTIRRCIIILKVLFIHCLFICLFLFFHLQKVFLIQFYSNGFKSSNEFKSTRRRQFNFLMYGPDRPNFRQSKMIIMLISHFFFFLLFIFLLISSFPFRLQ